MSLPHITFWNRALVNCDVVCVSVFYSRRLFLVFLFFFFNDPPPPDIYPLPLHAALPILRSSRIAIDRHPLPSFGHINQHGGFATQGVHVRIAHASGTEGGDRRIDGIAALAQDQSAHA